MCVTYIHTHVCIIYISIISPKINNTILKDQIFKKVFTVLIASQMLKTVVQFLFGNTLNVYTFNWLIFLSSRFYPISFFLFFPSFSSVYLENPGFSLLFFPCIFPHSLILLVSPWCYLTYYLIFCDLEIGPRGLITASSCFVIYVFFF